MKPVNPFLSDPEFTTERHLRRAYRFFWAVMLGGVAGIALAASLFPDELRRHPGGFLLIGAGYFVGMALWGRWSLSKHGIPGAEFLAYAHSRPSMWAAHGAIAVMLWWKSCHPDQPH